MRVIFFWFALVLGVPFCAWTLLVGRGRASGTDTVIQMVLF